MPIQARIAKDFAVAGLFIAPFFSPLEVLIEQSNYIAGCVRDFICSFLRLVLSCLCCVGFGYEHRMIV